MNSQTAKANKILEYVIRKSSLFINNNAARQALYLALVRLHYIFGMQHRFGHHNEWNLQINLKEHKDVLLNTS